MNTVLITGANGLIGRSLASVCRDVGLRTVGIVFPYEHPPEFDAVYAGSLQNPLENVFQRETIGAMVHGANHVGRDEFTVNTEGTKAWAIQASESGVSNQILLSSISAQENAVSPYGKAKYALERWFDDQGYLSFRLGLVIGNGGLFGRLAGLVKRFPMLPLPDGGKTWVYPTGLDSLKSLLCLAVRGKIQRPRGGLWRFYQPRPVHMRKVVKEIASCLDKRCRIINMPTGFLLFAARVMERIPLLKSGVSSNNILGMKQNNRNDFESDFQRFSFPEEDLAALVRKAIKGT